MFKTNVRLLPPFNQAIYEKTCEGSDVFAGDYSIFMTMMALLLRRFPEFKFRNKVVGVSEPSDIKDAINAVPEDTISFIWYEYDHNPDDYLVEGYKKEFINFERFLAEKLGQNINIRTYDDRIVCVFAPKINLQTIHAVQVFIPVLIPKYFADTPRTEAETKLLVSLSQYTDAAYKKEIQTLIEDPKLKEILLRASLIGFEKRLRTMKLNRAEDTAREYLRQMESILQDYRRVCEQRNTAVALAEGLRYQADQTAETTEFEEYLATNKNLTEIDINNDTIHFVVKTFVDPYLPNDWDTLSKRGIIYSNYSTTGSILDDRENMKLLLDAIFSRNHTLKLRICAVFDMDFYGSNVTSQRGYNFTERNPMMANYIPNGHLDSHNCFGQNRSDILMQMAEGDMIGAVECCINVTKRMNVAEMASFSPFIMSLKRCKGKCIVTEDGREMTVAEAVNFLKGIKDEASA